MDRRSFLKVAATATVASAGTLLYTWYDDQQNSTENKPSDNPSNQTHEMEPNTEITDQGKFPAEIKRNGNTVEITMYTTQNKIEIAKDTFYQGWTFDGTVPGPVLRLKQGDKVKYTLINKDQNMAHSIDFHAAQTPWNKNYIDIAPGKSYTFEWEAKVPGAFLYHCGTAPVLQHIANGMYGAILVDPIKPTFEKAREFVLVQSEFYKDAFDIEGMMNGEPKVVAFNGKAHKYQDSPLEAKPGELIRFYVINAGPNNFSAFHIVGTIFNKTYPNGNPKNVEHEMQTVTIPPGGSYAVELIVPDEGLYPIVSHSFKDSTKGATGLLKITKNAKDQPLAP
ncbi:multicopper oxidase domain-containing protein [Tepidibacillus fermentans]|uniref:Copper-containing nitrite reductase n=1 Tax=Tepidibacillus fermentans TaxID=1281767 RepID=A0A4V2US35_9BACI|nr:multicopper oxidase domain-containing protein [Tepidibacillus fermentans]TCS79902.1 nitrite reductase (NO-forming) [Tepidibacillus fermentans]